MTDPKKITLISKGKNWAAEFEGQITRRDIIKLHRVLTVEYANHERRRTVAKLMRANTEISPKPQESESNARETSDGRNETHNPA